MTLELFGLKEIPLVKKGDNIAEIIKEDLIKEEIGLKDGDIILIAETLISKAEGNIIELDKVKPSEEAIEIAEKCKRVIKNEKAYIKEKSANNHCDNTCCGSSYCYLISRLWKIQNEPYPKDVIAGNSGLYFEG